MGDLSFIRRIVHWGPLLALSIVGCITVTTSYCHLQWWPVDQPGGLLDLTLFLILSTQCTANLLRAANVGPGYVPLKWKPNKEDEQKLQYCVTCQGYKSPRSHHCRKCNRCVIKMDHHCPWINNCCGHFNQNYFIQFLLFAVLGCGHAVFILGPSIYRSLFRVWYIYYGTGNEPLVELGLTAIFAAIFSIGLAVGVVIAVGFLFAMQIRSVMRNRSAIEDYIVSKALHRKREGQFVYPYDLGWKENLKQVFYYPLHDGFTWPIVEGCDQFTFTIEQLQQKAAKRQLLVEYLAVEQYDGSLVFCLCWKFGCKSFFCQPLTDESRLKLTIGDKVLVSRWRRLWLYGQLASNTENDKTRQEESGGPACVRLPRGWFPRRCVVQEIESDTENNDDGDHDRPLDENHENIGNGDSAGHVTDQNQDVVNNATTEQLELSDTRRSPRLRVKKNQTALDQ